MLFIGEVVIGGGLDVLGWTGRLGWNMEGIGDEFTLSSEPWTAE